MAIDRYKTLIRPGEGEFVIQKSRFIGHGAPCETEEAARAFLEAIRQKHREANHNCYAYVIGTNAGIMRYSDDGEPGGTAGLPMMEVLKRRGVVNCCVVVTRYFGGVLLGAGGLVRAYTQGASAALEAAGVGEMHLTRRCLMDIDYPLYDACVHFLKSEPVEIEDTSFTDRVTLTLLVRAADADAFLARLEAATNARAETVLMDEFFYAWPE
ncbi:MAG: YigZ family protein [Clostridia bacterium]|nr:YigZ family protein [Clostridia bacterium]